MIVTVIGGMALSFFLKPAHSFRESLLLGWFGPVGVAAFFYVSFSMRKIDLGYVWQVGTLMICTSILAHGISSVSLTRLYGRKRKR